jgi:ADP-heptose:LPS heptosyltransferase
MSGNSSTGSDKTSDSEKVRKKEEHILVIRLSAMGDVAMLVPVLRVVTATYPHLKITVLTRQFFAPLFRGITNVEVYDADVTGVHGGVIGLGRLAHELRDLEITAVADMHDVLRSNILKTVFCFYGIPVKQVNKGRKEKKELTADNNKVLRQLKSTPQRYADVFSHLRYPIDLNDHKFPDKQKLTPNTRAITGNDLKKWVGIAPYAQHDSKVYPEDLLMKVLEDLDREKNIRIFLFGGGKAEKKKLKKIAAQFPNVTSLAGKLPFEEELSLISNLDVMLSMDSGNGHLAAIFGVPVITLWGVTHPYAGFKPFGQPMENSLLPDLHKYPAIPTSIYGNKVPAGYEEVMRTIEPEQVVKKVLDPKLPKTRT